MPTYDELKDKFLPFVQNPGQYVGREINTVTKDWDSCDVRVAMAFPDAYTIGSASLVVHIIYDMLNGMDGVLCERVFCPLPQAADRLRDARIPLYTLESYRAVKDFDILAFSVQYEMLYTNILEMLDLAGITLETCSRADDEPIILIGGSQTHNPEPIADFIDLACLGEAEVALPPLIEKFRAIKSQISDRRELTRELATSFHWLYAPAFYDVTYLDNGGIQSVEPSDPTLPMPVEKVYVEDLDTMPTPTKPIVPYVRTVHERINIEIMRGCPHGCRFCHEGATRRPVRYRSPEKVLELARETFANTGINEVSLFSLSSADHPQLGTLFSTLTDVFTPMNVSIALPSIRAEKQLELIPKETGKVRKTPMTFAIESADPVVRKVINKPINEEAVLNAARQAFECGWRHVKLYFMIGLPGENVENFHQIIDLAEQIARLRSRPAQVNISLSLFTAKSHTPLQWVGQKSIDYFQDAQRALIDIVRSKRYIKLSFHNKERSFLEAVFARGDRRLGKVLLHAWQGGARSDAWDEHFKPDVYRDAFEAVGLDPTFYANRNIDLDETLPWDHLRPGSDRSVLLRQLHSSFEHIGGVEKYFNCRDQQ